MSGRAEWYIAYLTEKWAVGTRKSRNPQHLTLVPPFEASLEVVLRTVSVVAAEFAPFSSKVGEQSHFGHNRSINVFLVEPSQKLSDLHNRLMDLLAINGVDVIKLRHTRTSFHPHVTIKPSHVSHLRTGQSLKVDHIAVIQKDKNDRIVITKEDFYDHKKQA